MLLVWWCNGDEHSSVGGTTAANNKLTLTTSYTGSDLCHFKCWSMTYYSFWTLKPLDRQVRSRPLSKLWSTKIVHYMNFTWAITNWSWSGFLVFMYLCLHCIFIKKKLISLTLLPYCSICPICDRPTFGYGYLKLDEIHFDYLSVSDRSHSVNYPGFDRPIIYVIFQI